MSVDATRWAWEQKIKSTDKLVLLSLADRADENFYAFPSAQRLKKDTGLNEKTVFAALKRLTDLGLIEDSGERVGLSGRIKIYRLTGCPAREDTPKKGTIKNAKKRAELAKAATQSKHTQKRNNSKNGIIPKTEPDTPENGSEDTPKNGCQNLKDLTNKNHGDINPQSLVIQPEANDRKPATETPPGFADFKIPDWLDPELWAFWDNYRKTRHQAPWDDVERLESLAELSRAVNQKGQNPLEVIRHAVYRRWKHPYPMPNSVGADIPIEQIVTLYNEICAAAGMLPCNTITPERQALIVKRVREAGMTIDDWEKFFAHAAKKPELTGKAPPRGGYSRPFKAQIDNLLNNKGFTRLDEELMAEVGA